MNLIAPEAHSPKHLNAAQTRFPTGAMPAIVETPGDAP